MNKKILDGLLNSKEYPLFKSMINNAVQGDTIAKMKELLDSSVDLLLVDLPYGTTQNKWDRLKDNIKGNKRIILLDTPLKLVNEGTAQHNCVGTYKVGRREQSAFLEFT